MGHVSPEATEGGPIAPGAKTATAIRIDIPNRTLTLLVDDAGAGPPAGRLDAPGAQDQQRLAGPLLPPGDQRQQRRRAGLAGRSRGEVIRD